MNCSAHDPVPIDAVPLVAVGPDPVPPANPDPRVVTVWSEISSPIAAYGLHILHRRAGERGMDLLVDHRAYPVELLDGRPIPKAVVDSELAAVLALEPELGWRTWPGPDATFPVTSLLPMEAVQAAKRPEVGGLQGSDELDGALRRAFLCGGRCISLFTVVVETARRCPLVDHVALLDALTEGRGRANVLAQSGIAARGVVAGSPQFVTPHGVVGTGPGDGPGGDDWVDRLLDALGG